MAFRVASYFELAFRHAWSIVAGSSLFVGALGSLAVWQTVAKGEKTKIVNTKTLQAERMDKGMRDNVDIASP
jgi:hypothetical protein